MKEYIVYAIITMFSPTSEPPKDTKSSIEMYVKAFEPPAKKDIENAQTISYIRLPTEWQKVK